MHIQQVMHLVALLSLLEYMQRMRVGMHHCSPMGGISIFYGCAANAERRVLCGDRQIHGACLGTSVFRSCEWGVGASGYTWSRTAHKGKRDDLLESRLSTGRPYSCDFGPWRHGGEAHSTNFGKHHCPSTIQIRTTEMHDNTCVQWQVRYHWLIHHGDGVIKSRIRIDLLDFQSLVWTAAQCSLASSKSWVNLYYHCTLQELDHCLKQPYVELYCHLIHILNLSGGNSVSHGELHRWFDFLDGLNSLTLKHERILVRQYVNAVKSHLHTKLNIAKPLHLAT